jgi:hypothetical protein
MAAQVRRHEAGGSCGCVAVAGGWGWRRWAEMGCVDCMGRVRRWAGQLTLAVSIEYALVKGKRKPRRHHR